MNDEKTFLSAEDILGVDDLVTEEIPVEEWNGTVLIRALTAGEAIKFMESLNGKSKNTAQVRICQKSIINNIEDKELLFTETQIQDLKKKNIDVINRIAERCLIINGLKKELVKEEEIDLGND